MRAWAEMFNAFLRRTTGRATARRTPTPTTSPTSTASPATTGCATSSPRAASSCRRAPPTTPPTPRRLRPRQPQERRLQRGARARRGDGLPRLGAAARPPARPRHAAGGRVVVGQRPGGARRRRARRPVPDRGQRRGRDRAGPAGQAGARHVPARGRGARRHRRHLGRPRGRRLRACAPAPPATSPWWSASTAASAPRRSPRPVRPSSSRTWPSWSRREARHERPRRRAEPARPRPVPDRAVGADRDRLPARRPRRHRDALLRRQRLPRDARQPRGGAAVVRPRHLPQRLPRDLADPARRGGVRLRPHRPDAGQRPRHQGHEDLRRRRAADLRHRRPRALRALPGLPRRRAAAQPDLAYAVGQAGPHRLHADGLDDPAPPRDHDPRGRGADRRRPDRDLVADPQPAGRRRRVPDAVDRGRRGRRPAQGRRLRRAGAAAADELRHRRPADAGLPVRALGDDGRGRGRPLAAHQRRVRGRRPRRGGPGQGGLPGRRDPGHDDAAAEDRRLPLLARRPGPRALRPVRPHPRPGRAARARALRRRPARLVRRLLGRGRRRDRRRAATSTGDPAGDPLQPLQPGPGERPDRRPRRARPRA